MKIDKSEYYPFYYLSKYEKSAQEITPEQRIKIIKGMRGFYQAQRLMKKLYWQAV